MGLSGSSRLAGTDIQLCYLSFVSRNLKAHVLLVLVTLVWGATFALIKHALQDISALLFNAVRMALASVALALIFRGRLPGLRRSAGPGILVGIFLYAGYEFQTSGLRFTAPSKSAFITGISVVLVPVLMAVGWRKRASLWTWLGVLMAFAGLYFMTVPSEPGGGISLSGVNFGDWLTLACAFAFAMQIIFVGRATSASGSGCPFEHIALLQAATAAVLMAISAPLLEHVQVRWSASVIAAILITGLLGTAAAFSIQAWAQQFLPATHTALIFALEPVFAWLTSFLFLNEHIGTRAAAGGALILAGVLTGELLGQRAEKPEAATAR
jgi:drug/metabolite transporter (DMT)-like permease